MFTVNSFTATWQTLGVRPPTGDTNPERTDEKYCVYDELHRDYGYTPAYVKKHRASPGAPFGRCWR